MATNQTGRAIPTELTLEQFHEFVLPHLTAGSRGPRTKLTAHALFNYILNFLYLGCQWKQLPIEKDEHGRPEIHYSRVGGVINVVIVISRRRDQTHTD